MMKLCLFVGKQILHQNYWQIAAKRENFPGFENYQKLENFYNKRGRKCTFEHSFLSHLILDAPLPSVPLTLTIPPSPLTHHLSSLIPHQLHFAAHNWFPLIPLPPSHPSPFILHSSWSQKVISKFLSIKLSFLCKVALYSTVVLYSITNSISLSFSPLLSPPALQYWSLAFNHSSLTIHPSCFIKLHLFFVFKLYHLHWENCT